MQQYNKLMAIKSICNVQCQVADHHWLNSSKGIIYIQDYDITKKDLKESLMLRYGNIEEVAQAQRIYPRNLFNKPFLVTFRQADVPADIQIPGDKASTKVYPYRMGLKFCRKYLEYNHTEEKCDKRSRGGVCSEAHVTENCDRDAKCYYCKRQHRTGEKSCPRQKQEEDICNI